MGDAPTLCGCESVTGGVIAVIFLSKRQTLSYGQALPAPHPGANLTACSEITLPSLVLL